MPKQHLDTLKQWFVTLAKPTQSQFWDWLDSYRHKDDKISLNDFDAELKNTVQNLPNSKAVSAMISDLDVHTKSLNNPHGVTAEQLGLDATRDKDKPVSTAMQDALDTKADKAETEAALTDNVKTAKDYADAHANVESIHKTSEQIRSEIVASDIPDEIARYNDVITQLMLVVGDAIEDYNTLHKLQGKLQAVESLIYGDDADSMIETLNEALNFINTHKSDIDSLVNTYIGKTDIVNDLYTDDPTKVLSAKMGAVLYGQIESLNNSVNTINTSLSYKADKVTTFVEAAVRENIQSGENTSTIYGKMRKWLGDIKALAFKDKADFKDDVSGKPATLAGYGITDAATFTQGTKADTAVQSATIGGSAVVKVGAELQFPAYPTNADSVDGIHILPIAQAGFTALAIKESNTLYFVI